MGEMHRAGSRDIATSRLRALLAASTALTALAIVAPARAQAPLATPTGGAVVAGSASIAQAPGQTTVTQGTARAAINWQSFNVGSRATVQFQQPNSQAVTLNRVLTPNPSQIAGRITANGSIVLVNPDGIVFAKGAEVNTAGLIATAAGISNGNFMAGRMVFDRPANPNARVVNQGSITIAQAGLAALVAPQVANSGVIAAKLGNVVLAGARTATLDLYGDGLVSLDVQGAVRSVPVGPDGKPVAALVTNTGTIVAQGGTVLLTAKAVDGLIQKLVDAGGAISANGASGAPAGTILVQGVGGSIRIDGTLTADGEGPGGTGGAVGLDATGAVTVAHTARIDASGPAGGGVVAVGTTLARAKGGPGTAATLTAAHVQIAPGATISADATGAGNGGRVAVLSTVATVDDGAITAEGGPGGGNGGFVEVSGHDLALDGTVNTSAPLGVMGTILLDPYNLTIVDVGDDDGDVGPTGVPYTAGDTTAGSTDTVSASVIEALTGNVTLQAINDLEISANLALTGTNQSLLVEAGNNVTVDPGIVVSATGNIDMDAASTAIPGVNPDGSLVMNGVLTAGGTIGLIAGQGGMFLGDGTGTDGSVSVNATTGFIDLFSAGVLNQTSGIITAGTLSGEALAGASLPDINEVANLGPFTTEGQFTFNDAAVLAIAGTIAAYGVGGNVTVQDGSNIVVGSGVSISAAGNVDLAASSPAIPGFITDAGLTMNGVITAGGNVSLSSGFGGISLGDFSGNDGNVSANATTGVLTMNTTGDIQQESGAISAGTLTGSGTFVFIDNGDNAIGTLGAFTVAEAESMFLTDSTDLTIAGPLNAPGGFIGITSNDLTVSGAINAQTTTGNAPYLQFFTDGNMVFSGTVNATGGTVSLNADGSITEPGGAILADTLSGSTGGAALFTGVNTIGTLAVIESEDPPAPPAFSAGGNFTLVDNTPLTITAPITVPNGATIALVTDGLTQGSESVYTEAGLITVYGALEAPGGLVSVAPYTAGVPVALVGAGSQPSGTLSLDDALLAAITAGTLALSSSGSAPITISGANQLGNLTDPNTGDPSGVNVLEVSASGAFTEAAGASLNVGTLTGSAASVALGGSNIIPILDQFSSTGGFALSDMTGLTVLGTVSDSTGIALDVTSGGGITLGNGATGEGSLSTNPASGTVALTTAGSIDQSGGVITAGTLSGSATLAILDGDNAIGVLGAFTLPADSGLFLNDATNLTVAGPVSAIDGFISLTSSGDLAFSGELNASGGTVVLTSGGGISEPGGSILADTLSGASGGAALFTGANTIGTLAAVSSSLPGASTDAFLAGGNFTLADNTGLTLDAPVSVPTGDTIALVTDSLIEGSQTVFTSTSSLTVFGALLAPGGEVSLEPFTANVPVALVGSGPQQAGTLSVDDALLEVITAGTLALTSSGSEPISISGTNQLGGLTDPNTGQASGVGALLVSAGGAFSEAAGAVLDVGVLGGSAGDAALDASNLIPVVDGFTSGSGFSLTDADGLIVRGTLRAPGDVNLVVPDGSIRVANGSIIAGTLSGAAAGLAAFGTADVATLGSFSVSGSAGDFSLTNSAPLTISGPVSAAFLDIAAPGTLALSGTILTTGLPLADQTGTNPALPGSVLEVLSGGVFQELGTSVIAPLGSGVATLRIQLPAEGGLASFANLQAGAADIVLALGPGEAVGTLAAGGLLVIGTGGNADLFGAVGGISGPAAAGRAGILPYINPNYLFNACVIGTTTCGATLVQAPLIGTPNLLLLGGGPSLSPAISLPPILLVTIPAMIGETWTDEGGYPLPNIARLDF